MEKHGLTALRALRSARPPPPRPLHRPATTRPRGGRPESRARLLAARWGSCWLASVSGMGHPSRPRSDRPSVPVPGYVSAAGAVDPLRSAKRDSSVSGRRRRASQYPPESGEHGARPRHARGDRRATAARHEGSHCGFDSRRSRSDHRGKDTVSSLDTFLAYRSTNPTVSTALNGPEPSWSNPRSRL